MRSQGNRRKQRLYYRCRAREMGFECRQKGIPTQGIAGPQVIQIL
jgi:hypothetical protein